MSEMNKNSTFKLSSSSQGFIDEYCGLAGLVPRCQDMCLVLYPVEYVTRFE